MVIQIEMFISILFTFASTTVKIYLEFSENELFEKMKGIVAICLIISASLSSADIPHLSVAEYEQPPPQPYAFSYTAGRFNGHIDRAHSEVSDGQGVVRGAFSYIDPKQEIRSVEYVADKNGFHPILSHPQAAEPQQTQAVKQATIRHFELFNEIAQRDANNIVVVPKDTASVARAKERHFTLYDKIAAEHAQIGAELEAERALFESTSEKDFTSADQFVEH